LNAFTVSNIAVIFSTAPGLRKLRLPIDDRVEQQTYSSAPL
jgi:hypothetical protein